MAILMVLEGGAGGQSARSGNHPLSLRRRTARVSVRNVCTTSSYQRLTCASKIKRAYVYVYSAIRHKRNRHLPVARKQGLNNCFRRTEGEGSLELLRPLENGLFSVFKTTSFAILSSLIENIIF